MSIQLIQQAISYMEAHILEDINYTDVAKTSACPTITSTGRSVLLRE